MLEPKSNWSSSKSCAFSPLSSLPLQRQPNFPCHKIQVQKKSFLVPPIAEIRSTLISQMVQVDPRANLSGNTTGLGLSAQGSLGKLTALPQSVIRDTSLQPPMLQGKHHSLYLPRHLMKGTHSLSLLCLILLWLCWLPDHHFKN